MHNFIFAVQIILSAEMLPHTRTASLLALLLCPPASLAFDRYMVPGIGCGTISPIKIVRPNRASLDVGQSRVQPCAVIKLPPNGAGLLSWNMESNRLGIKRNKHLQPTPPAVNVTQEKTIRIAQKSKDRTRIELNNVKGIQESKARGNQGTYL